MSVKPALARCAIYTRKSSDEGLDQEFNSLDAQREASEAYINSQTHEGWRMLTARYDDGGYSGGSMDRPGLQHLLSDIAAGKIDVVVVYKIDRLTRSLADFARMVELFDKHEVSFVSVTQSFNTTSSMGRLTLNVLLSFAQFEREVTGERIRDKIAASKAKGMWMGGNLPLGYDAPTDKSRTLVVNENEAKTVQVIFAQYLKLGSVHVLEDWLKSKGYVSKRRTSGTGKMIGGVPFSRSALYHLLRNPIYLGKIRHKGELHQAKHPAIVDQRLWDQVQQALDLNRTRHASKRLPEMRGPLAGRIFDACGEPMSPTTSRGKKGRTYRYYVSTSLQRGGRRSQVTHDEVPVQRIAANAIESHIESVLVRLLPSSSSAPLTIPIRIEVHRSEVHLTLAKSRCAGIQGRLSGQDAVEEDMTNPDVLRVISPIRVRNRRGRIQVQPSARSPTVNRDPILIAALQRAHAMTELDARHLPVCRKAPETQYGRRLLALAFLAPDLQRAILDGHQPADLTLEDLIEQPLPADWPKQRALFDCA